MRVLFLLIWAIFGLSCHAQVRQTYKPYLVQDTIPFEIYDLLKARNDAFKLAVTGKGKVPGYVKDLYDYRFDYVVKSFNEDYMMVADSLTHYVQSVLDNIYEANPQLDKETQVYLYRSESPNAISFGDGTLAIMLGLLERVETEDVLAFILCHELAHYHQHHTDKNFARLAELNYDKVLKKQINQILNSPYQKYSRLKSLFSSLELSVNQHSRVSELEADSIGLTYFLKTKYNRLAPLRCMQILAKADSNSFSDLLDFKKYFHFKDFPFKNSWAEYKKSDVWYSTDFKSLPDSARTHPACKVRFEYLQRQLAVKDVKAEDLMVGRSINNVMATAELEMIHTHYHFKQYGKALFKSMIAAEKYPLNAYAHAMITKSLFELYQSQKNHTLAKVLDFPDPRYPENYDRFLSFIHELRLFEVANLSYHYAVTRPVETFTNEDFIHALWMVSRLEFSKLDPDQVKVDYQQMFPDGRYLQQMKNK